MLATMTQSVSGFTIYFSCLPSKKSIIFLDDDLPIFSFSQLGFYLKNPYPAK